MKRSKHTLSNYRLFTANMGELIPCGLQEALPGDTFQLSSSAMIRVSPLAAPVMHPVTVRLHHFFVPHRLMWPQTEDGGWEEFITGGPDGDNAESPPTITVNLNATAGTLWDYLGIPSRTTSESKSLNALPLRGINAIWNEYFRDQDLQTERAATAATVPNIAWGKDYFTSARPWTQKGPEITVPLGGDAPVITTAFPNALDSLAPMLWGTQLGTLPGAGNIGTNASSETEHEAGAAPGGAQLHPTNLVASLADAAAANINDFRRAFALQRYQEARARYGSRYTEYLRYLGVTPSDARLQRPEYLGGGSARLNFSEVLQTAADAANPPDRESFGVGDLYGHGIAGVRHRPIRRFIEEHGYIHSFMSVRPKGIYMNGIHRTFLKSTKEDFWQRELQHIGQQPVYLDEIYGDNSAGSTTFGYQDRYSEYRETPSLVMGEFRNVLDYWHMARDFGTSQPALNSDFVTCVPTTRIHNVQTNDTLWCMVNNHVVARRLVSRNAQGLIL